MRFLLLASAIVHKAYLCDGSVDLQAISQGLASFNTQIIGPDVDLCDMTSPGQGLAHHGDKAINQAKNGVSESQSIRCGHKQTTNEV